MFRVIYLTEAGKKIGFGHLKRAESLKRLVRHQNWHIYLEDAASSDWKHDFPYWSRNKSVKSLVDGYDIVIFDSFVASDLIYNELRNQKCVLYLDDFLIRNFSNGLVIDWTVGAELRRKTASNSCFGLEYLAVREEFLLERKKTASHNKLRVSSVFGGSDPFNYTQRVFDSLSEISQIELTLIGTKEYPSFEKFKDKDLFRWNLPLSKYIEELYNSDLVITAGGQTLYELAVLQVPAIACAVTPDQINDVKGFAEIGCCIAIEIEKENYENSLQFNINNLTRKKINTLKYKMPHITGDGELLKRKIENYVNKCYPI